MPIPSFLNNLTKGQNNLSPNAVNTGLTPGNAPTQSPFNPGTSGIFGNSTLNNAMKLFSSPQPQTSPSVPVTQPVPVVQGSGPIESGNTNNPLNQYSNNFGQDYANSNMGGYNPVAEYHRLQGERTANLLQGTGPYAVPKDVPMTSDDLQSIRKAGDSYYENQMNMTRGEAEDTMSNLKNTITGGVLGTLPPATASAVKQHESDFNNQPIVKQMNVLATTLSNAKDIYDKNKSNMGLANGTDDYRMMFLLSNAMNPNSQVSEGDYANAQAIMGTFPAELQSKLSAYIQTNPDGSLALSDKKKGFLTPEGRKVIYDAIKDHYISGVGPFMFQRGVYASQIDKDTGRPGLGESYLPNYINPETTVIATGSKKPTQISQPTGTTKGYTNGGAF